VIPAAIVWAILGIVLRPLAGVPFLLPLLALVYALWFGVRETLGLHRRLLGLVWQVPSSWIKGRPAMVRTLIWGTTLGPGLVTKNPYAGMWLLPLLVALNHNLLITVAVSAAVGASHGAARAIGVLRNRKCIAMDGSAYLRIFNAQTQWQYIDGLALLLAAGALGAYALFLQGVHF
jgi:hypothetical protein